ncbi:MAG: DUF2399 domain-containing protein [Kyrpidia tusciae]|nr:Wadjet anti-phage system protein JetD domain-containing protein [Kyrpidia tusciae]MBE3551950.1 DUF2399 domain-containing protein [Kyrpidia tusciae]
MNLGREGAAPWMPREESTVKILDALLKKYESSQALVKGSSRRRPQVSPSESVVPGYVSGGMDPEVRKRFHGELARLEQEGVVSLRWVRFEEGNVLDRVYLEWEGVDRAYACLGRAPVREESAALAEEMEDWLDGLAPTGAWAWVERWVEDVVDAARGRGRVGPRLVPGDPEERRRLLNAIEGLIREGGESLPVRLFSKRYLGNSKAFEQQVQGRLIGLLQRYAVPSWGADPDMYSEPADLLREVGIEVTHDWVAFCGPIRFRFRQAVATQDEWGGPGGQGGAWVDAGALPHGLAIDAADVDRLEFERASCTRIVSIENKANYRAYLRSERREGELVLYLGGFASPGQRRFLRRLRAWWEGRGESPPPFDHWGDLDYGGILILQHLRETCWPEAAPWRMDPEILCQYADRLEPYDATYRAKLERLLEQERYRWAWPLVRVLLEKGGTLEQEATLV